MCVLRVPGEPVQPGDDDPAALAALDPPECLLEPGTVELAARLVQVGQDVPEPQALLTGQLSGPALLLLGADQVLTPAHTGDADVEIHGLARLDHCELLHLGESKVAACSTLVKLLICGLPKMHSI